MNGEMPLDRWEEKLRIQLSELKKCQAGSGYSSCMPCPKVIKCEIREAYVKAVYESMNKGEGGGFEF